MPEQPLKILQVSSESGWRGGEQQIAYLLDELQTKGVEVHTACRKASPMVDFCREKSIPFLELPFKNNADVYSAWKLARYARKHAFQLVHVHSSRGHGIAHLALKLGLPCPLILTRRVAFPLKQKSSSLAKYNHPRLIKILCVSRAVLESTAPAVQDKDLLKVVYSGIDLQRFRQQPYPDYPLHSLLKLPRDTRIVGITAALTSEKDVFTFIKAAAKVHEQLPDIHFAIIGDGPERTALEELSHQLKLIDNMHFTGRRNDVAQLLPELSCFLFTSTQEGLGTSVLEAFASQVPVVSTNAGGLPEMVLHNKTGLIAEIGNADQLAKHVIAILQQPELAEQFTSQATQHLRQHFTKEVMAAGTLQAYREIINW